MVKDLLVLASFLVLYAVSPASLKITINQSTFVCVHSNSFELDLSVDG